MKYWIFAAVVMIMAACSNDVDDKLEGKWQLQQVETNGEVISADTVYYNFQNSLFMYQIYVPAIDSFRYSFGFKTLKDENQLILELTDDPGKVQYFLPRTDWKSGTRTFTIEESNRKHLILNSEGKRYTFRKF